MNVGVFRARTEQEREELFRFRYSIYVEEMGRYRGIADHAHRLLIEPEDSHSVLYGAREEDGAIVGTSRMTYGAESFSSRQIDQYWLAPFLAEAPASLMAIGERLMVAPSLRGSSVAPQLRGLSQEDIEASSVRLVFGDCEPHLLSLNLSEGGRTYAEHNINSEEAGYLIPLVWLVGDLDGLATAIGAVGADGRPHLPAAIAAALTQSNTIRSSSLMDDDEYWPHVASALERIGSDELQIFADFDAAETRECISRSNIIECDPGDRVLKRGGTSHNLFVVLEGTLEVHDAAKVIDVLGPGDVFGEMAFLLQIPRQFDVFAATDGTRILSLSDKTLRTLTAEEPTIAAKLMLNISRMLCVRLIKSNVIADAPT